MLSLNNSHLQLRCHAGGKFSFRTDISNGSLRFQRNKGSIPSQRRILAKSEEKSVQVLEDENGRSTSRSFLSVLCPLLKLFAGGDPSKPRNEVLEMATSSLSSIARLPWGSTSLSGTMENREYLDKPPELLQLFEFEACPFCRRVREAMTELDLSIEVYPCPKGSIRHREVAKKIGGKELFPFLVDPNTGISMYESGDIVKYLFKKYGHGRKPTFGLLESTLFTGWVPTLLRAGRGMTLWDKATRELPSSSEKLELFSYENNPYARIVREALCELELPYILHNAGKGSSRYDLLVKSSGSSEVPYLIDRNTGAQISDYKSIVSYLFKTYSTGTGN
ncbi:Glutathione S-transferase domain-containing protein [Zostera marina]|uniref:Glutathione S-transferase domain-containing protein n=1 Tax=Zostera marina TaxID=29655 RepID=A0A0K9PUC8_ZOSMR|nr:Glutathione S-transferase domain-containing protein [Zostera marina]